MQTIDYRRETRDRKKTEKKRSGLFFKIIFSFFFSLSSIVYCLSSFSYAADKNWNSQGDGTDWFDAANWLSVGVPEEEDNAKVDLRDANVELGQSFDAGSLTVGGKKTSTVNVSNFVTGTVEPGSSNDDAMIIRRDGKLILKGSAGTIKVKGSYKDSEEIIPEEPGFMLYVK